MKNILITSAGKRVALVRIFQRELTALEPKGKVYTVDVNPQLAPACFISDGYFSVSRCTSEAYISELLQICKENNIGVIIPTIDTELMILSENRQRFLNEGVDVVVSDSLFVRVCRDKRFSCDLFGPLGIPVPEMVDKYHPVFPMFAKPYDGSLSTNIHIIRNQEELTKELLEDPKLLFMKYIDKMDYKEFSIDMYYGKDGNVKGIVPRERLEVRAGEINKGITRKNYIVAFLKERMEHLEGVRGCICLQLFYREKDNDIKGIEINPRFGGGFPLSYYAKANYADYVIREYLMGESVEYSEEWLDNTLTLRYDNDVIIYDTNA